MQDSSGELQHLEVNKCVNCLQTTLHDITSHKRVLDTIKERAGYLLQASPNNEEVLEAIKEVESRHEALASRTKANIEDLEWMIDRLTTHQDLSQSHADWQKDMWEKLHSYTGIADIYFIYAQVTPQICWYHLPRTRAYGARCSSVRS